MLELSVNINQNRAAIALGFKFCDYGAQSLNPMPYFMKPDTHNPDSYHISIKVILKNKKQETLILKNAQGTGEQDWHDIPGGRINTDEFETDYK